MRGRQVETIFCALTSIVTVFVGAMAIRLMWPVASLFSWQSAPIVPSYYAKPRQGVSKYNLKSAPPIEEFSGRLGAQHNPRKH